MCILLLSLTTSISVKAASPFEVTDCYWTVNDERVTSANVGEEITAHIVFEASEASFQGTVLIEIIQDNDSMFYENEYVTLEKSLIISKGGEKEVTISFKSYEATGDVSNEMFGDDVVIGYYIKITYQDETIYEMEDEYPPRLNIAQPYWAMCVEDSYISDNEKTSNHGGESNLEVQDTSRDSFGSVDKSYLKFDLSELPDNSVIDKAYLKIYTSLVGSTHQVGAHHCSDSDWNEFSITWNNAPDYDSAILDETDVAFDSRWYGWDVTQSLLDVKQFSEETYVLESEDYQEWLEGTLWFYSKDQEYDWVQKYKPKLAVYWHEPKPSSSIDCTLSSTEVQCYSTLKLKAELYPALSNVDITLSLNTPTGTIIEVYPTDSSGTITHSLKPNTVGQYTVSASWTGNNDYEGFTSTEISFSVNKADSDIDLDTIGTVIQDEECTIQGSFHPSLANIELQIQLVKPDDTVVSDSIETGSSGDFECRFTPSDLGIWTLNMSWVGNEKINPDELKGINFEVVEPPPTGSIEINVKDENSDPINGAIIKSITQPTGQPILQATSVNGVTQFTGILTGSYEFEIEKSGYKIESIPVTVNENTNIETDVILEEILSDLKIIIKDNKANPTQGATVTSLSQPSGQPTLEGVTGPDGSITFTEIKPGDYEIMATMEDYETQTKEVNCKGTQKSEQTIILTEIQKSPQPSEESSGGIPGFPVTSVLIGLLAISLLFKQVYPNKDLSNHI